MSDSGFHSFKSKRNERELEFRTRRQACLLAGVLALLALTAVAIPAQGDISGNANNPQSEDLLDQYETSQASTPFWKKALRSLGFSPSPSKEADEAYAKGDFDLALQKYAEAGLDNPESPILSYNSGNAQYKKGKYDEAIQAYQKALAKGDASLNSKTYYNLGNTYFRKGEASVQAGQQEGIQHYREAMANYKKALEIRPDDAQAKRNIEVVQARIKELLERKDQEQQQQQSPSQPPPEPSAKAKEALARAMQLVAQKQYPEAKRILEAVIQEDSTAAGFQSHVQKIDDVIRILEGKAPASPAPSDPRTQQKGLGVI